MSFVYFVVDTSVTGSQDKQDVSWKQKYPENPVIPSGAVREETDVFDHERHETLENRVFFVSFVYFVVYISVVVSVTVSGAPFEVV